MITRLRETNLLWPLAFSVLTFCVLIALGNWQWSRMHWKQDLLEKLAQTQKAEPVKLGEVWSQPAGSSQFDRDAIRFRRVTVTGTFAHENEMHVWAPGVIGPAWSVVTPLRLESQSTPAPANASYVLVVRGIVPAATKPAEKRIPGQVAGTQTLTGRIRLDLPNTWANAPSLAKNEWFTRDLALMTEHLRRSSKGSIDMAPFFIEAEQQVTGAKAPKPQLRALTLSNRHLEYALTWWGLAATLIGVFTAFAWDRLKTKP